MVKESSCKGGWQLDRASWIAVPGLEAFTREFATQDKLPRILCTVLFPHLFPLIVPPPIPCPFPIPCSLLLLFISSPKFSYRLRLTSLGREILVV